MTPLSSISGIGKAARELLEVAGFPDVETLAQAELDELVATLEKANGMLHIVRHVPKRTQLKKWLTEARKRSRAIEEQAAAPPVEVNYEAMPEVQAMIDEAPVALPLSAKKFVESGVAVSEIPPAILLNRFVGDLDVRVQQEIEPEPENGPRLQEQVPLLIEKPVAARETSHSMQHGRVGIDVTRLRTTTQLTDQDDRQAKPSAATPGDRISLIRSPLEKTNRGKKHTSRRYIRGVLLSHPLSFWFLSVITLMVFTLLPLAVIAAGLLMLSDMRPDVFHWVPKWLLIFPILLPPTGVVYLLSFPRGCCQVCRQKLFWPRHCIKNSKAHHVKGLGYIVPLCIHVLLFRWFRCTYCGTPLRLKE